MKKKSALITGAAKRIGKDIALYLAANGWDIALHYNKSQAEAEEVCNHIKRLGRNAYLVQAELADKTQLTSIIANANKELGTLSCLINNASSFQNDDITNLTPDSWHNNISVNLYAPTILAQEFVKQLPKDKSGNIINMLDYSVWSYPKNFLSYTTSKAGLWAVTQQLALALAPKIRVNAIGPGRVFPSPYETIESFHEASLESPLQNITSTEEICNAITFILSSPSLTGQMLALDSGKHLVGPEKY